MNLLQQFYYNSYYQSLVYIYNIIFVSAIFNKNLNKNYIILCCMSMLFGFLCNISYYNNNAQKYYIFLFFNNLLLFLFLALIILIKNNNTKNIKILYSSIITINVLILLLINYNKLLKPTTNYIPAKKYLSFHHKLID